MTLQVILIQPGSTDYDRQGRIKGNLDVPLCPQGRREVSAAIDPLRKLGIDCLYASPAEAAQQTSQALAESLNVKSKTIDKLQNLDHGLWQGMLIEDVKTKQPKVYRQWQEHPENICPPEGETVAAAQSRVAHAIGRLLKKHKDGVIGLVLSEPLASIARAYLSNVSIGNLWKASDCGSFEAIAVEPKGVVAKT